MDAYVHFALLASLSVLASVGVYVRGRRVLGLVMLVTCMVHALGMQYITHSPEVPGFTEKFSIEYSTVRIATDVCLFVYLICVVIACWMRASNHSVKPTR